MTVRTRFAPSPTGYLHIGSVRTALYAWLYARKHKGEFILRIEDTDHARSTEESIHAILDGMAWLQLNYDQGPFYQMERLDRYQAVLEELISSGHAYRCTCPKERLEQLRAQQIEKKQKPRYDGHCRDKNHSASETPHVVRFRTPLEGDIGFHDEVYGDIRVNNAELDDVVLVRSDGVPTYNFSVVVDDTDMQITHVIRGDDHINNTPRQVHIYYALGKTLPTYAHVPMILGEDGKRLSKRHGAVDVRQFREGGYLPQALLNYLIRLGWSHGDQEIFSINEMIENFDLAHLHRSAAAFNPEKLLWVNQHYIKETPAAELVAPLCQQFETMDITCQEPPALTNVIALQVERSQTLLEMAEKSHYFYADVHSYDEKAQAKFFTADVKPVLHALQDNFAKLTVWQQDTIHAAITTVTEQFGLKFGKVAQPLRLALTGGTQSPSIAETAALIGKDRVLQRLQQAMERIA